MRLLLDAQLSGRVLGQHFRQQGHEVFALDEHRELEGIADPDVMELATRRGCVLITHNVKHFPNILRDWADSHREHAGCVLLVGVNLDQFGLLIKCIEEAILRVPDQEGWRNLTMFMGRRDVEDR